MTTQYGFRQRRQHPNQHWLYTSITVALFLICSSGQLIHAQVFNSGSNGSDGALNLTTPGTINFDPGALGLDPDGDHVYHFTTITIGAGVTVRLSANQVNGPVFWLASGAVQIDGIIDLNGQNGQSGQDITNNSRFPAIAGSGGFNGGVGGTAIAAPTIGNGPGGGSPHTGFRRQGSGGGHAQPGGGSFGGPAYGNDFLVPLVGGSGGGGGRFFFAGPGGGGGAGGGAILIASSTSITVNGTIQSNGGSGGNGDPVNPQNGGGGGGSGGAIHLLAPTVSMAGTLSTIGGLVGQGDAFGGGGSPGRIRIEGFQRLITGTTTPPPIVTAPFGLFLPTNPPALVRVVSITDTSGIHSVSSTPTGSFTIPDITINDAAPVTVNIEARSIPLGTVVQLHLFSETGADQIVDSTALAGTLQQSTATATVTIPSGFSRGFARATWTP